MVIVHQADCGSFEVEIQDRHLDNLVAIAIKSKLDPDDIIRRLLIGCLRLDDTNILLKGRTNELERKDGGLGRR